MLAGSPADRTSALVESERARVPLDGGGLDTVTSALVPPQPNSLGYRSGAAPVAFQLCNIRSVHSPGVAMRILYGVVGEGMGHATRSRVILEHLLSAGHEILVVVSGRAHRFLKDRFKTQRDIRIEEIHGLRLVIEDNELDVLASVRENLDGAPGSVRHNIEVYRRVVGDFKAQMVISDFESWAYVFARLHDIPVVSIDNMQVLNRCQHDDDVTEDESRDFRLAKLAVKAKLPGAYHYLVTSFFFPPVRKKKTTLVPPILRPEILRAVRGRGEHILVYQTASTNHALIPQLKKMPYQFRVYGMERDGDEGNVSHRPFSETGFIHDLATARGVIAGWGYSLLGEAVHLQVQVLSVPIEGQFEQTLNARYIEKLGYGQAATSLDADRVEDFIANLEGYAHALESYVPRGNEMLFACVDELIRNVSLDEPPKDTLETPAMGSFERYPLDDEGDDKGLYHAKVAPALREGAAARGGPVDESLVKSR